MRWLALLMAAVLVAACGEKPEPTPGSAEAREPFTVILDYFPNADHAGIYAAQAHGLYDKAGLDLKIVTPPDPAAPLKLLQAGRADVAISYEPELLLARDAGAEDLISVAALVQQPLTALMALPGSGVRSPQDLAGKRVGTAGIAYQHSYLQTILQHAGVDPGSVKETDIGFDFIRPMVAKKVAATLGGFWNYEGVELQRQGRKPVIMRMEQLGVPTYDELIVAAKRASLDTAGASRLRRFLSATAAGYRLVKQDPANGVDPLVQASKGLDPALQTASVKATLPAFFPSDASKPWGNMELTDWARYERWMRANKLLTRAPSESAPLTDEFLPGAGLDADG